jgi:cyclophilin family peptidyl-prolyl cis-trans isomerase
MSDIANDAAIAAIDAFIAEQATATSSEGWRTGLSAPPKQSFDTGKTYYWDIETNVGSMTIELMPAVAPMHVTSTIYLARLGFYDGLSFHRVIESFMAQGGCPLGTGTGGPGYQYGGEFDPSARHDRPGLLSMANAGPGTDGSQFFITFVSTPHLDDRHSIFGAVTQGLETLKELETRGSGSGQTSEPLGIVRSSIRIA